MLMISLKHAVCHSYTAVGIRVVVLAHTGKCPEELVRIKKSFFDHNAVVTASVVG